MFITMQVKPAYGRTYKDGDEVLKDWFDGKDFYSITHSGYCSIRNMDYFRRDGVIAIHFFFNASLKEMTSLPVISE